MLDQNVYTFLKLSILTDSYNVPSAPMTNFNNYHFMARLVVFEIKPRYIISTIKFLICISKIYYNFTKDFHTLKKLRVLP